jgi:hypothetical protein
MYEKKRPHFPPSGKSEIRGREAGRQLVCASECLVLLLTPIHHLRCPFQFPRSQKEREDQSVEAAAYLTSRGRKCLV